MPDSRDPAKPRIDPLGMVLSADALASAVYAIIEGPALGWFDPVVIGAFTVALFAETAFVLHQLNTDHPMLNVRLFRNPRFSIGTATIVVASFALAGLTFTLVQYLQIVREYTPFEAGLRMVPLALGFGLGARRSSLLVARLGTKKVAGGGLLIVAVSLIGFSFLDGGTAYWIVGTALAFIGLGSGSSIVSSTDAVMDAVPEANVGVGSAVNDTARQVGYALGVGIVGAVLNTMYSVNARDGLAELSGESYALAHNSLGGAVRVATSVGGPVGDSIRTAANASLVDAFGLATIMATGLALIGAMAVFIFMPPNEESDDIECGGETATTSSDDAHTSRGRLRAAVH